MSEINLLPQKKIGALSEERLLFFANIAATASVVLVVSLSILFFILSRDPTVNQQKADEARTIAQLTLYQSKTAKYLIIVDRVGKLKALQKQRGTLDATLDNLTQQVPRDVVITALSLDKNTMSIALGTKNLSLLGNAVDNFSKLIASKKALKSLTVQGIVSDEKTGNFVLSLTGDIL